MDIHMHYYPIMSKFNYVIAKAVIDGKEYYLDASEPRLVLDIYHFVVIMVMQE